jgi:hypothetical protein
MRTSTLCILATTCLLATLSSASAFTFVSPPAGATLNLSSTIDIVWNLNGNEQYNETNLQFNGVNGNGGSGFTYDIVSNISLSQGNYLWNPRNGTGVYEALMLSNNTLSDGADYTFTATLHNNNPVDGGAMITSDKLKIDGISLVSTGASLHPQASRIAMAIAVLLVITF